MNSTVTFQEPARQHRYLVYAILGDQLNNTRETLSSKCHDLEIIAFEELRIAVQATAQSPLADVENANRMQEFSDVLCELHRFWNILPFRFGTIVEAGELPKFFGPQKEALLRSLEHVAGCVEINLRWAVPDDKIFPSSIAPVEVASEHETGYSYLRGKWKSRQREMQVESLLADTGACIQELVGDGCVAIRTSISKMRTVNSETDCENVYSIAKLDLLILRHAYPRAMQTVATIPFCSVSPTLISGPWPPFSFVEGDCTNANKNAFPNWEQSPQVQLGINA
jgi:Gas vesicle synthesis protein GvpL/GvpF